jgi:hypothetical protein
MLPKWFNLQRRKFLLSRMEQSKRSAYRSHSRSLSISGIVVVMVMMMVVIIITVHGHCLQFNLSHPYWWQQGS